MPLEATLTFPDILCGIILHGPSREINFCFRNTGSKPWPPGVTLKPDNGSCPIKASSESLPQTVLPGMTAVLCLTLDFSEAKPGHYVLWFVLVFRTAKLGSVSVEFLLRLQLRKFYDESFVRSLHRKLAWYTRSVSQSRTSRYIS